MNWLGSISFTSHLTSSSRPSCAVAAISFSELEGGHENANEHVNRTNKRGVTLEEGLCTLGFVSHSVAPFERVRLFFQDGRHFVRNVLHIRCNPTFVCRTSRELVGRALGNETGANKMQKGWGGERGGRRGRGIFTLTTAAKVTQ
jgi:hypothetical protein